MHGSDKLAADAIENRIAFVPEDRKTEGLMLPMAVCDNLSFAALDRLSHAGIIDRTAERKAIEEMIKLLAIRTDGVDKPVGSLSGVVQAFRIGAAGTR